MNNNEFVNYIIKTLLYFELVTLIISFLLMFCSNLFKKADKSATYAFIPIGNLIFLNSIAELPNGYTVLYFIPVANVIYFFYVLYKISIYFNTSKGFYVGMIVMPIIFLPILSYGNYKYREEEQKQKKLMENVKASSLNLFTQEEIDALNKEKVKETSVDSVYKSDLELQSTPSSYKASTVDVDDEFSEVEFVDVSSIKRVKPVLKKIEPKEKTIKKDEIETLK